MSKETGGPAFPTRESGNYGPTDGMTLRDYFAGQALIAVMAQPWYTEQEKPYEDVADCIAEDSYIIADAMIKERNK